MSKRPLLATAALLSASALVVTGCTTSSPHEAAPDAVVEESSRPTAEATPMEPLEMLAAEDAPTTLTFEVGPDDNLLDSNGDPIPSNSVYRCTGSVNNPHWSKKAGSVIAKTKILCKGPASRIPIRVYSLLGKTPVRSISSLKIVAESNYVQNVTIGKVKPWYVPRKKDSTKIPAGAYFRAASSGRAEPPLKPINIGKAASRFVFVPKPK